MLGMGRSQETQSCATPPTSAEQSFWATRLLLASHRSRAKVGDLRDCWAVNRAIALTVSPHTGLVTEAW
jgi:hypothetical protein